MQVESRGAGDSGLLTNSAALPEAVDGRGPVGRLEPASDGGANAQPGTRPSLKRGDAGERPLILNRVSLRSISSGRTRRRAARHKPCRPLKLACRRCDRVTRWDRIRPRGRSDAHRARWKPSGETKRARGFQPDRECVLGSWALAMVLAQNSLLVAARVGFGDNQRRRQRGRVHLTRATVASTRCPDVIEVLSASPSRTPRPARADSRRGSAPSSRFVDGSSRLFNE